MSEPMNKNIDEVLEEILAKEILQQPDWDLQLAKKYSEQLAQFPALVSYTEVVSLKNSLREVAEGKAFFLQGGDCAETFSENSELHWKNNLNLLQKLSNDLCKKLQIPIVKVARIAGQYAKPRSGLIDREGLPVYRGDMVNRLLNTEQARISNPRNLITAHENSAKTIAYIKKEYSQNIIYVSHEALILNYELPLLKSINNKIYDLSAHYLWIGERTRKLEGAHVALLQNVVNPIGVKIGPATTEQEIIEYINLLDPNNEPGRLTFVSRMGANLIEDKLPDLILATKKTGHKVIWQCDPMHGNTVILENGTKTRYFETMSREIKSYFNICKQLDFFPGGIHLEFAGGAVTECIGGAYPLIEAELPTNYVTACDPRLNYEQSVELVNSLFTN